MQKWKTKDSITYRTSKQGNLRKKNLNKHTRLTWKKKIENKGKLQCKFMLYDEV
jgi:hypothetical protein